MIAELLHTNNMVAKIVKEFYGFSGNQIFLMHENDLIRKHLDDPFDPWQVGYDYISTEVSKFVHKMPDAMPWYLTTKAMVNEYKI